MTIDEYRKALATLLSAAGIVALPAAGMAADDAPVKPRRPTVKRPAEKQPAVVEKQPAASDLATVDPESAAKYEPQLPPVQAKYGLVMMQAIERGNRAEMTQMAREVRRALDVLSTPEGRRYAASQGVDAAKFAEVEEALGKLEAALAESAPRR